MAEEAEKPAPDVAQVMALAGASRDRADAFLDLQMEEVRHENPYKLSHLRLRRFSDWAKAAFEFSAGLLALALAAGVAFLVWNAANSNDLVMDSFQVPPELAARGLSGAVVAAKLSDKITAMQVGTTSTRPPRSYANGLSDGLKLEIPETGVSLAELDRFLREKLSHDLHIGGEIVQTETGVSLTARVGADSATVPGAPAEMDALLQKLAEEIYHKTQPYRFAVWLQTQNRNEESLAVFKQLAAGGPPGERAWAYNGWAVSAVGPENDQERLTLLRRGLALDPHHFLLVANIAATEFAMGRQEESLRDRRAAEALLAAHGRDYALPGRVDGTRHTYRALVLRLQGALQEAVRELRLGLAVAMARGGVVTTFTADSTQAELLARLHEVSAARAVLADRPPLSANAGNIPTDVPSLTIALEEENWPAVLTAEKDFAAVVSVYPRLAGDKATLADVPIALALAHLGRFAEAEARLKDSAGDCYPCLVARALVAALQGQAARADWWFAHAAAQGPSLPQAESEWGKVLLARGKPDDAIGRFTLANEKGPHFADPLEGWGEALMAQNQSHLALTKFKEAEKYAPNWGRLHLKWGEALVWAGKPDEARTQFARAAALDLTPSEKAELAKVPHG
jgi:tetratricopeptide (TPR) repeat protein